jgi:hypothetical protein
MAFSLLYGVVLLEISVLGGKEALAMQRYNLCLKM